MDISLLQKNFISKEASLYFDKKKLIKIGEIFFSTHTKFFFFFF